MRATRRTSSAPSFGRVFRFTIAAASIFASAAGAQTVAITGGRVFPVSGAPIDNATVLIRDGKIAAVGTNVVIPAAARRIDATGPSCPETTTASSAGPRSSGWRGS